MWLTVSRLSSFRWRSELTESNSGYRVVDKPQQGGERGVFLHPPRKPQGNFIKCNAEKYWSGCSNYLSVVIICISGVGFIFILCIHRKLVRTSTFTWLVKRKRGRTPWLSRFTVTRTMRSAWAVRTVYVIRSLQPVNTEATCMWWEGPSHDACGSATCTPWTGSAAPHCPEIASIIPWSLSLLRTLSTH